MLLTSTVLCFFFISLFSLLLFFYWVPLLIWKWVRHRHQRFVVFLRFEKQTNKWDLRDQVRPIQCFWNSSGTLEGPGWLIRWRAGRGNAEQRKKRSFQCRSGCVPQLPEPKQPRRSVSDRLGHVRIAPRKRAFQANRKVPQVPFPFQNQRWNGEEEDPRRQMPSRVSRDDNGPFLFRLFRSFFFPPKVFSCSFFFLWKKTLGKARRHLDDVMESVAGSGRAIAGEITEFSRCLSSSYRAGLFLLLCSNGFSWVLLGFARVKSGYYLVLTRFYRVFLGFTGFYRVLLVFTEFYWVLLFFFQV